MSLENFIDLDDKIRFNTDEYSLYTTVGSQQHLVRRRFQNKTDDLLDLRSELSKYNFKN